ncbi:hypothetical protein GPECTOR_241g579 [Gonium pectorale]|uniref:Peptidase S1 domain-containing protein n=1 Tax=Gonium pectorale TaxID=33097 RepID=A0A150FWE4_GONPE|nr:hypothetical protein GPECTOR_241g579 [Gonium pectorale]|eukprot:KXZ41926.1 hypothetical protein GPECTOR_241g579 [Gonium pectorale]
MRLLHRKVAVGTVCCVKVPGTELVCLLTARHCFEPQPGCPIDLANYTAYEKAVRFVVGFPEHDLVVLVLEGGAAPDGAVALELAGEMGLCPLLPVYLLCFTLDTDLEMPDQAVANKPLMSTGSVCYVAKDAKLAVGDFSCTLPNSSGGAVVVGATDMAGMQLGTFWHRQGEGPPDASQPKGQHIAAAAALTRSSGAPVAVAAGDAIEADTWASEEAMAPGMLLGHGVKRGRADPSDCAAALKCCLDNVPYKDSVGYFLPAHVLYDLLRKHVAPRMSAAACRPGATAGRTAGVAADVAV